MPPKAAFHSFALEEVDELAVYRKSSALGGRSTA